MKERGTISKKSKKLPSKKTYSWREVFKEDLEKYGEVGVALKGARAKEEFTQKELADELGIKQHHISEMENGKRAIGKEMAKRLSKVFHVSYKIFF